MKIDSGFLFGAVLGALGLAGCSSFDHLDFQYKSAPPDGATVQFENIRIHEGIAVGVTAIPMDGSDVMDVDTMVELESQNPGVLGVAPGTPDPDPEDDSQANWNFVVFGASAGATTLVVRIDGDHSAEIPAVVEEQ